MDRSKHKTSRTAFAGAVLALLAVGCAAPGAGGRGDGFARDRAAIETLLYSYAHHFDGGRFDAFLACFADDAVVQFGDGPTGGKEQLQPALQRGAYFARNGIQRRHVMTNLRVLEQTADVAAGDVYVLLVSTDADGLAPVLTGFYEFEVRRRDGEWRIQRWRAHLDGAADRVPAGMQP